uniref:Uncharacterized protein n=1 Tax=Arundo donax TaxID=35708 RepID=A0A0A9DPN1_ARUDO
MVLESTVASKMETRASQPRRCRHHHFPARLWPWVFFPDPRNRKKKGFSRSKREIRKRTRSNPNHFRSRPHAGHPYLHLASSTKPTIRFPCSTQVSASQFTINIKAIYKRAGINARCSSKEATP